MYRTVVTICTALGSIYVTKVVTVCTAQWSRYLSHSGHYMYRTVVTLYTAQRSLYVPPSGHYMYRQFNIQQFYILPTQCFMCFVWISGQTAIISLHSINWLVFVREAECAYCAVRTGSLNATDPVRSQRVKPENCCIRQKHVANDHL